MIQKDMCSICAGTKKDQFGKNCICKDGTIYGELAGLRLYIYKIETRNAKLETFLKCLKFENILTFSLSKEVNKLLEKNELDSIS